MARGIGESFVWRWQRLLGTPSLANASKNRNQDQKHADQSAASLGGCNHLSLLLLLAWQARQQAAQVVAFAPRSQMLINNDERTLDDGIKCQPRAREQREPERGTAQQREHPYWCRQQGVDAKNRVQKLRNQQRDDETIHPRGDPERKKHQE